MVSTSSSASRGVPDLIGGGGHSRNGSAASSVTSLSSLAWSGGCLSRNPSSASSMSASSSRRGYTGGVNVNEVIMEDDDEEWLETDDTLRSYQPFPSIKKQHHRRGSNASGMKKKQLDSFGMGKDMRDVLEEIIQMERGFIVDDEDRDAPLGLFTATFDRPPRTPSPTSVDKRISMVPVAPGAPARGHRSNMSQPHPPLGFVQQRPPSLMGLHQSSLSESHTALYLATASPKISGRRSASPSLHPRESLSFSSEIAGPIIENALLSLPGARFDSPSNLTPSRRRPNISPTAHHPAIGNWRFPSNTGVASDLTTPTRPVLRTRLAHRNAYETPVRATAINNANANAGIEPQLLWPPPASPLAPALFPSSPATSTPDFATMTPAQAGVTAPNSGVRLGVLLGSMSPDEGMDVDADDDTSTADGHGRAPVAYLPVFLEAEGFRSGARRS
ncbi:MAG: hypothetical protein TREMPRED_000034 [Tremellales sp. Tagirdzhanova-0007]|nr:MAG: hypothetical protein TREMPRED_000034 [Tremellales sp. Tagirdzhanova-0007]